MVRTYLNRRCHQLYSSLTFPKKQKRLDLLSQPWPYIVQVTRVLQPSVDCIALVLGLRHKLWCIGFSVSSGLS